MAIVPFSDANTITNAFLCFLAEQGITPASNTRLEDELLSVIQLLEIWKHPQRIAGNAGAAEVIRNAASVHDFAAKLLAARDVPEFGQFDEHLKLIATGTLKTTLSQITENDPTDDVARKLVELYVACLAVHCGENIKLDHPTNSRGDNPDILLSYHKNTWALAIKTPSSRHGQTLFENIQKAGTQIECSAAHKGLVVVNVRNQIDHEALWNASFAGLDDAIAALKREIEKVCEAVSRDRPSEDWDAIFVGKKTVLPVLLIGQSVVLLPTSGSDRTPTPLKMMLACGFDRAFDEQGTELANCLTHWMQVILRGEQGPPPS